MSLAQSLYFAAPLWLQRLAIAGYGWRLRYLRGGSTRRRMLGHLLESQWHSPETIAAAQLRVLAGTVAHAYGTVPLYRRRGTPPAITSLDDLRRVPLLHKDDLRGERDLLVSERYRGHRLHEIHTGGTTGKPLTIYADRVGLQRNYAFFDRLRTWAGVSDSGRTATFAGRTIAPPDQRKPPYWRPNPAGRSMLYSSYHIGPRTIPDYVASLEAFGPDLIDAYPSSIEPIARYLLSHGTRSVRPRAVITSSETLLPTARSAIEQAFGCGVLDHYGAAEMAAFITQCEHGTYHQNPEFGVVEILRDGVPAAPGETGMIVATGFVNQVMPLVRYATGDLAVQGEPGCRCGRAFPAIERIVGRLDDVIVAPDGRRVGRLDPIFKAVASLYETRIVQDREDHVTVEFVTDRPVAERERVTLIRELQNRLGPLMRIDLVQVDSIPRAGSGKLRTVENLVSGASATLT